MTATILVVDDQPQGLKVVSLALLKQGYKVLGAQSGAEALAVIAQSRPDLVILDVMMPDMDGFEVCRRIRANPELAQLPVLMLTARGEVDDKLEGFESGADDYMVKPVSLRELLARVKVLLARTRTVDSAPATPARARELVFVGVKGGVGTTTLAVNTAIAATLEGKSVILLDMHPRGGTAASQLGHKAHQTIHSLLAQDPAMIKQEHLDGLLLSHKTGLRVLPAGLRPRETEQDLTGEFVEHLLDRLRRQADLLILDLEPRLSPATRAAMKRASRIALVTEVDSIALRLAREWLEVLEEHDVGASTVGIVVVNRGKAATAYTRSEMEELLGRELLALIIPEPELCLHASKTGVPILLHQRDGMIDRQLRTLTQNLMR